MSNFKSGDRVAYRENDHFVYGVIAPMDTIVFILDQPAQYVEPENGGRAIAVETSKIVDRRSFDVGEFIKTLNDKP